MSKVEAILEPSSTDKTALDLFVVCSQLKLSSNTYVMFRGFV